EGIGIDQPPLDAEDEADGGIGDRPGGGAQVVRDGSAEGVRQVQVDAVVAVAEELQVLDLRRGAQQLLGGTDLVEDEEVGVGGNGDLLVIGGGGGDGDRVEARGRIAAYDGLDVLRQVRDKDDFRH